MSDKSNRPSPSVSATLFKVGTQRTGNDGNTWVVKQTPKGVKRWVKDLNAVPFSAPTTPSTQNYFLLKNGVQILEEKVGGRRAFRFELNSSKIAEQDIVNLVVDLNITDRVDIAKYEKEGDYFKIYILLYPNISANQEIQLFENIETILNGLGYGQNIGSSTTPKTCNTTDVPPKNIQDYTKNSINKGDIFYYYNDLNSPRFVTDIDTINYVIRYTRIDSLGDPSYEVIDFKKLDKDLEQCEAFFLKVDNGGNFYNEKSNIFLDVSSVKKNGGYDIEITEGGSTNKGGFTDTEALNMYLAMGQFRPFDVSTKKNTTTTTTAPTKKIELNIADVVAQTSFSKGLKESMINDFKSSGFEDVWLLIGNDVETTSENIQKNIIGFSSGKNNYIQADELADIIFSENQKLKGGNKPSALTNVEPILGVNVDTKQHLYIYGVADIVIDDEAESTYFYNYSKDKKVFDDSIVREAFFVKGDVISYEINGYKYDSLVDNIYRDINGNVLVDLENTYTKDVETFSLYGGIEEFEDVRVVQYYNLWELFDNPVLVTKTEDVKEKNLVDKQLEDEIKSLNKQIADLVFLRSLLLPIDFEKKIDFGQRIADKQKKLNELNFKLVERRLGAKDIFDELFDQSFVELKHSYTDVKGDADTDYFAPDGKRSELSDELNVMIRTPDFKLWFGDWELAYLYKDTDVKIPCSKVVNSNYEPMVVWHGTGAEFSYFKFDNFPATYFAKKKAYSDWFANLQGGDEGFTIPFFLDIKNPLDLRHFGTRKVTSKEFFDYIFLKTGLDMDMLEVNPIFMSNSFPPNETWVYLRNNAKMLKKLSESKMNDGIMFFETNPSVPLGQEAHETEAYIIFNANQSKIASTDRGMLLLSSLKSFLLKKGGQI